MVTGTKQGKYEKAFVSGIYNGLCRWLFGVPVTDLNSVKAYRREIMDGVPLRPDWHRYMVVIAAAEGFRLTERRCRCIRGTAGKSASSTWRRIPVGVLDLLSVWFQLRFGRKPLLFFGMVGAVAVRARLPGRHRGPGPPLRVRHRVPAAAQPGRDDGHHRHRAVRLRLRRRDDRRHAGRDARPGPAGRAAGRGIAVSAPIAPGSTELKEFYRARAGWRSRGEEGMRFRKAASLGRVSAGAAVLDIGARDGGLRGLAAPRGPLPGHGHHPGIRAAGRPDPGRLAGHPLSRCQLRLRLHARGPRARARALRGPRRNPPGAQARWSASSCRCPIRITSRS